MMPKCYLVANIDVTDPKRFEDYREKVPPVLAQFGGKYLVRGGAVHPLEGDLALKRLIILEFESLAAARRFYDSAEYAPLLKLRMESTQSDVAFVEGYAPA